MPDPLGLPGLIRASLEFEPNPDVDSLVQTWFEERGTIEVFQAGPTVLPDGIFDTSTFVLVGREWL